MKGDIWQNVRAALYNDIERKITLPHFKTDKKHQRNAPKIVCTAIVQVFFSSAVLLFDIKDLFSDVLWLIAAHLNVLIGG